MDLRSELYGHQQNRDLPSRHRSEGHHARAAEVEGRSDHWHHRCGDRRTRRHSRVAWVSV